MTQKELEAAFIALNAEMAAEKEAALNNPPRLSRRQQRDVLEGINRRYAIRKAKLAKEPIAHNSDRKKMEELYRLQRHFKNMLEYFRMDEWEWDDSLRFFCIDDTATFSIRLRKKNRSDDRETTSKQ